MEDTTQLARPLLHGIDCYLPSPPWTTSPPMEVNNFSLSSPEFEFSDSEACHGPENYDLSLEHDSSYPTSWVPPPEPPTEVFSELPNMSISPIFHANMFHDGRPHDVALLSSDSILFLVHTSLLPERFQSQSSTTLVVPIPVANGQSDAYILVFQVSEISEVLNVILHTIYEMPCTTHSSSLDTLNAAFDSFPNYGLMVKTCIAPSTPLFTLLLSCAPLQPLEVYTLASRHDLYDLAVIASPHLLGFPLWSLTDEISNRIGPLYLKRLFMLHHTRLEALRRMLFATPHPHGPEDDQCNFVTQRKLSRAWTMASAYVIWDAKADISPGQICSILYPLGKHLSCEACKKGLVRRIKEVIVEWTLTRRTI